MVNRIFFHGSAGDAKRVIRDFVAALTGTANEHSRAASAVHTVVGFAALSDIQKDFIRKAKGGIGEDGVKWPPLNPATLAYGRKAPTGKGHAPGGKDGLLTNQQLKRWRQIYGHTLARLAMKMDIGEAKGKAAAHAWTQIKKEGGRTKIDAYKDLPHEILRSSGVLFNSLSPGQLGGDDTNIIYSPPSGDGGSDQVFALKPSGVIVGTNVVYARTHNEGDAKRGIPARPFLPKNVPQSWKDRWLSAGLGAIRSGLVRALEAVA